MSTVVMMEQIAEISPRLRENHGPLDHLGCVTNPSASAVLLGTREVL